MHIFKKSVMGNNSLVDRVTHRDNVGVHDVCAEILNASSILPTSSMAIIWKYGQLQLA